MKYLSMFSLCLLMLSMTSCKSNKKVTEAPIEQNPRVTQRAAPNSGDRPAKGDRKPPSVDEIFNMDTNGDGLLAKNEVKGPLERDFDKVDSNQDGFISRKELENAPKPERGQRPPR